MAKKTPPFPEYPAWTDAKFWAFIRSALRSAWMRWPSKYNLLNKNRKAVEGKRHKWEYQCEECRQWFQAKEVQVDHKVPAGSLNKYEDLPAFVSKLFVGEDKLAILCKPCHQIKTNEERKNEQ